MKRKGNNVRPKRSELYVPCRILRRHKLKIEEGIAKKKIACPEEAIFIQSEIDRLLQMGLQYDAVVT
jgi:hypothetical protein